ncbi:apolipoprotein N-acyltransferase [Brevundimonas sp.]|uniref:apolipoprotein N-acyltransferase n=1 Tax=Brevundimonas sp. TaxID=1871086 RepID=UPI0035B08F23
MTPADWTRSGAGQRLTVIAASLVVGALAALAHPPFGLLLPGLLAYPALLILGDRAGSVRAAFWRGWLAGFAYFFIGCWWVAEAFLVNPDQAWMAPFAACLLPAGMGLFWGGALALFRRVRRPGLARVALFAGLFCLFEWLRGWVLTGFPWNPAGASWAAGSAASQTAALVGVYGLGLITVLGTAAFAPLVERRDRKAIIVAGAGLALIAVTIIGGAVRLARAEPTDSGTVIRIVQANIEQQAKWTPENFAAIVQSYVSLTAGPESDLGRPDVVIWPEGALPTTFNDIVDPRSWVAPAMAEALDEGQVLIVGLSRAYDRGDGQASYGNSAFAMTDIGVGGLRVDAVYDKHHLVPFGEYLPAGPLMSRLGVRSLVHVPSDFTPGPPPQPFDLPGVPRVQPLICYESLFPGMTPDGAERPAWIVNPSNDAWYGATSGPVQNFNLSAYRAIEEGLPMARATPTGVSALIDPWGRPVDKRKLETGARGVIDARLPQALEPTPYSRWGDWPMVLAVAGLIGLGALSGRGRREAA